MDLFSQFWQIYLYQPLVNMLVYLYNTVAGQNLGWAVVSLTICLRILLLPLSILSERNEIIMDEMDGEVKELERTYRTDPILLKEHVRALMRKYHMRPWAKTSALGIQLLVLILLYQVFITGITGQQLVKILYSFVEYPGKLNTLFFSLDIGSHHIVYDIGQRSIFWAALVAVILIIDIAVKLELGKRKATGSDITYIIVFPLISFLILWYLPMVKALFILTSMMFSYLLIIIRKLFWGKGGDDHGHGDGHGDAHGKAPAHH